MSSVYQAGYWSSLHNAGYSGPSRVSSGVAARPSVGSVGSSSRFVNLTKLDDDQAALKKLKTIADDNVFNFQNNDGDTMLHQAIEMEFVGCFGFLVQRTTLTIKNDEELTPFQLLKKYKNDRDFPYYDFLGELDCGHEKSQSRLIKAVLDNDLGEVTRLVKSGNPNYRDKFGRTALHYAALDIDSAIVKTLLEGGIEPGTFDYLGYTACGCAKKNTAIKKILNKAQKKARGSSNRDWKKV